MNRAWRNGRPSAISTVAEATAIGAGYRITQWANRYQPPRSSGRAARSAARCQLAGASAFTLVPSSAKSAGSTVSATRPASGATINPPIAIERRKPSGKTSNEPNAAATVTALNATVRPAVCDRHPQRLCARPVTHELLPIARHEQQAVVDREAEPRASDEVERED